MTTEPTAFTTIDTSELDAVTGGEANVNVSLDGNKAIDSIGAGAQRLLGCATGAQSLREFGNCILTGQLDSPQTTQQPQQTTQQPGS